MRKAPFKDAKKFALGKRRIGNDGNMWEIIQTKKGVRLWRKVISRKNYATQNVLVSGARESVEHQKRKKGVHPQLIFILGTY